MNDHLYPERIRNLHKRRNKKVQVHQKHPIDAAAHATMVNWARWAREPMWKPQHCRSIEWKFSIPKFRAMDAEMNGWRSAELEEMLRKPDGTPVDEAKAFQVELAVCAPGFDEADRALLKGHYVLRADRRRLSHMLSLRFGEYDFRLHQAVERAMQGVRVLQITDGKN